MAKALGGRRTVSLEEVELAPAFQVEAPLNVLERRERVHAAASHQFRCSPGSRTHAGNCFPAASNSRR
jgi:hypothetical protein